MNMVINIDDFEYEEIKKDAEVYRNKGMIVPYLYKVIESGTPLPKGHGRLGDLDMLLNKAMKHRKSYMEAELGDSSYCRGKLHAYELYVEEVENADTIIEADRSEE